VQFLLLPHIDEAAWQKLERQEQAGRMAAFGVFAQALQAAGAFVGAYRPQPSMNAATVKVIDGKPIVGQGPLEKAVLQLSGVYVIEVADRKAALSWAERLPASSYGVVEVRPVAGFQPAGRE
jgi:hypothetical protein